MAYLPNEDRSELLIDAAIDVIASEGLAAATTRKIVERAESSLSALHYCFGGKDDLLAAVLERIRITLKTSFADVDPSQGFEATVRTVIASYWRWIRENPGLHMAIAELVVWEIRRGKPGKRLYKRLNSSFGGELLRRSLEEAAAVDGLESAVPTDELARFILHRFDGLTFEYAESADAAACERQTELLAGAVIALAHHGL